MKMRKQRLMGALMVLISAAILALASTGETVEDRDATAVLLTLPLGIYMMVTKQYILYDDGTEQPSKPKHNPTLKGASTWQEHELPKPPPSRPGKTSTPPFAKLRRPG